jgi:hypothetical protein
MLHRLGPRKAKAKLLSSLSTKRERLVAAFSPLSCATRALDRLPALAETTANFCCGVNGGESWRPPRAHCARSGTGPEIAISPLSQLSHNRAETEDREKLSWVAPKLIHPPP